MLSRRATWIVLSTLAFAGAIALVSTWLGSPHFRLRIAFVHVASGVAFLGVLFAIVSDAIRNRAEVRGPRWPGLALGLLNVVLAVAMLLLVQLGLPVPPIEQGLADGQVLPEVTETLVDSEDRPVTLESLRGEPTLLVFYRGHW